LAQALESAVEDDSGRFVQGDTRGGSVTAYLVLMQQVDDVDRYRNEYVPGVTPFLKKHGGEVVVGGFEAAVAEGEPPNSTVVLRFADAGAAWGFLNDPEYQPVRELRFSITSRGQAVVVPEFTPSR
jgi:uncharacterized protein (DUF1330 family)